MKKLRIVSAAFLLVLGSGFALASGIGGWSPFTSADASPSYSDYLRSVACASASDCWAVGWSTNATEFTKTLVEHWNGTAWSIVTSPNTSASQSNYLYGVACASATECWAVGNYYSTSSQTLTLVLRWNGTAWSIVSSPNADTTQSNTLSSVACASTTNCFAVGVENASTGSLPLIERWNGTSWKLSTPATVANSLSTEFQSVTCPSTSQCWAVGFYADSDGVDNPLMESWNGTAWAINSSSGPAFASVDSVACAAVSDCWAVGYGFSSGADAIVLEHWNGSAWSQTPAPGIPSSRNSLVVGLTCSSTNDCWVVGTYSDLNNLSHSLIEHWNGTVWSIDPASGAIFNDFEGVACSSSSQCWIAGSYLAGSGVNQTRIERYVTPLVLNSIAHPSGTTLTLSGTAAPNSSVTIAASPDLSSFQTVGTPVTDANGALQFTDSTSLPKRFYQAAYP